MSFQAFLLKTLNFVNETIIPFILALAFLFFIYNMGRYFFWAKDAEEGREQAKLNAFWGILGFVVIVSIWGIVNMFVYGLDFDQQNAPCPDYNPNCEQGSAAWDNQEPQCIGGVICTYEEDGHRTCFAC